MQPATRSDSSGCWAARGDGRLNGGSSDCSSMLRREERGNYNRRWIVLSHQATRRCSSLVVSPLPGAALPGLLLRWPSIQNRVRTANRRAWLRWVLGGKDLTPLAPAFVDWGIASAVEEDPRDEHLPTPAPMRGSAGQPRSQRHHLRPFRSSLRQGRHRQWQNRAGEFRY